MEMQHHAQVGCVQLCNFDYDEIVQTRLIDLNKIWMSALQAALNQFQTSLCTTKLDAPKIKRFNLA